MRLDEILHYDCGCDYEVVYIDEEGNEIVDEAFVRQMKKMTGGRMKKQYRCTSGQKKGKIVSDPKACAKRKDPKKRRHGKKVARSRKGVRILKTKIAKRKTISRMISRINKRLAGKSSS